MKQETRIRIILLIWIFISGITGMFAQSCLPDGITFDLQSQIDNFQTNYPGCTIIEGDVYIEGDDIHSLGGLSVLTAFNGNVIIRQLSNLHNLTGLDNITSVEGDLKLEALWNLSNVSALSNLYNIGGDLIIEDCDSLQSFEGFENLLTIGGDFLYRWTESEISNFEGFESLTIIGGAFVVDFTRIENFVGLNNLTTVSGVISVSQADNFISFQGLPLLNSLGGLGISKAPLLQNLVGLENVETLEGNLSILECEGIVDLMGIESLTAIEGMLYISQNPSLIDISQLISVTSVGSNMTLVMNSSLTSLSGIDNIDPSNWTSLTIQQNSQLSNCAVLSVCEFISNQGQTIIIGNAEGCETEYQIQIACESLGIQEVGSDIEFFTFPNPFTTSTSIEFALDGKSKIQITIYNSIGEMVYMAEDRIMPQGTHQFSWSPYHMPAGLYYAVLRSEEGVSVVKMVKQ